MKVSTLLSCLLPVLTCGVVSLSSPQAVVGPQDRTTGRSAPGVPLDLPAPERLLAGVRAVSAVIREKNHEGVFT